jgi:hypothetical protein
MISLSADPPRWRYSNQISRREANRAIYFDFEGRVNESLAFRGVDYAGSLQQFVFDPSLAPLVNSSRAAGERVFRRRFSNAIEECWVLPAEREDRRLIAFSEHELRVVHSVLKPELAERIARRFLNARAFAAAWVSRDRADLRKQLDPSTLGDFATICNFEWPPEYDLQPAEVIQRLRKRLATLAHTPSLPR